MSAVLAVTGDNFDQEVLKSDMPVIVDFWAEWCAPCKAMLPVFDSAASEYQGKVKFVKLNVEEAPNIASQYGISGIPSLLFFQGGEVKGNLIGFQAKQKITDKLKDLFSI